MANKTLLVAKREYLENVRTKTFWIGIFIVPVLIAASIGVGALLRQFKEVQRYAVVDLSGEGLSDRAEREFRSGDFGAILRAIQKQSKDGSLQEELTALAERVGAVEAPEDITADQQLALLNWIHDQPAEVRSMIEGISTSRRFEYVDPDELGIEETETAPLLRELTKAVHRGDLFGFFVLGEDPLRSYGDFLFVSDNQTDDALPNSYQDTVTDLLRGARIREAGIKQSVAERIQERVVFQKKKSSESGEIVDVDAEDIASQWAPVGFVYFLWIAIFSIANLLLTNTVEEKSNRIIEVLLSSVSPSQLMHGKIYGIAFTGMTIIGTWVVFALLASWLAPALLGEDGGALGFIIAAISNTGYLTGFVLYFLGGYLLYAAVLVAIGSVCNTLKEAQNLIQPVMMVLMVPLIAMVFITQEPNGTVAKVLSYVPIYTPFTMMNRAAGPPETWEYVATSVLLVVTIWLTFKAAGKVFRVGVLMTGNPPKLKEILGWMWRS
jgi:ABC-2 type transport system permease protein